MTDEERIAANVRRFGWHSIAVDAGSDEPALSYSVGFGATFSHPEVVVLGLAANTAHSALSAIAAQLKTGHVYSEGQRAAGVLNGCDVSLGKVHPTQLAVHLGYALGFYRELARPELLTALQLFWPDERGMFPFELKCDPKVAQQQPRLSLAVPPSELEAFFARYR